MFNIARLSNIVVNFILIMMSKPKYIVILTVLFCSVVAGVLRTFTRFFVNVLARVDFFGMTTMAFGLAKPRPKS